MTFNKFNKTIIILSLLLTLVGLFSVAPQEVNALTAEQIRARIAELKTRIVQLQQQLAQIQEKIAQIQEKKVKETLEELPEVAKRPEINLLEEAPQTQIIIGFNLRGVEKKVKQVNGETHWLLSLPREGFTKQTGKPKLPQPSRFLAIPRDAENIKVDILDADYVSLGEYKNIYPVPKQVIKTKVIDGKQFEYIGEEFYKDKKAYQVNAFYPGMEKVASLGEEGRVRDTRVIRLLFHPIQYNPVTKTVRAYNYFKVKVSYESPTGDFSIKKNAFGNVLKDTVLNYKPSRGEKLEYHIAGEVSYPTDLTATSSADYLIITADAFYESSHLSDLANHRASLDYNNFDVAVVKTSDIYNQFPAEQADVSIKNFITYAYDNWEAPHMPDGHIEYVLLVGDADEGGEEQIWYLPPHITDSDLPCSISGDLASDDWYVSINDDNDDGVVDDCDFFADMLIGRFPVSSTEGLSAIVNKTITVEQNTPQYNSWGSRVVLIGTGDPGLIGIVKRDLSHIRNQNLLPAYKQVTEAYNYELDWDEVAEINIEAINNGVIINSYYGHGGTDIWEHFGPLQFARLENDPMFPVIFSEACSTGHFDDPEIESLGEMFIESPNKGASGFIGASRRAWAYTNLNVLFHKAIFEDEISILGQIFQTAKLDHDFPEALLVYNLLGDPALDISYVLSMSDLPELVPTITTDVEEFVIIGDPVTITFSLENIGQTEVEDVKVRFFNGDPEKGGPQIGPDHIIPDLPADGATTIEETWTPEAADTYEIYGIPDPEQGVPELSEYNNKVFSSVEVKEPLPDLMISSEDLSFDPEFPDPGEEVTISANIHNIGVEIAEDVLVRFSNPPPPGLMGIEEGQIGPDIVIPSIAPEGSEEVQVDWAPPEEGQFIIRVGIDPEREIPELREHNNSANKTLVVGNQPPVLNPIGNKEVNEGELLEFIVTASDPDGDPLTYSASNLPPGAEFDPETRTFSWIPDYGQAGVYEDVHFEVTDGVLTNSEDITIRVYHLFNIDLTMGWNMISFPGHPLNPDPESLVGPGSSILLPLYKWNALPAGYEQVTELKPGEGYWILTLEDETLNVPLIPIDSITLDLSEGWNMIGGVSITVDISDPQDDPDGCVTLPALWFDPVERVYAITTQIEPGKGYWLGASQDCTLTLEEGAAPEVHEKLYKITPTITKTKIGLFQPPNFFPIAKAKPTPLEGRSPLKVQFSSRGSYDPLGKIASFRWDFGDGSQSDKANPIHIYEFPADSSDQTKVYTATLTVFDNRGATSTDQVNITLLPSLPSNWAPVLDSIGDKEIEEGKLLEFTITASDPDKDPLTYSASNLPEGATFVGQTFSWRPSSGQAGVYPNVHFEVSDGKLTDSEDIIITVIAKPKSLTVVSPNGGEEWTTGTIHNITWQSQRITKVNIYLYDYGTTEMKPYTIATGVTSGSSGGSYSWTISNSYPVSTKLKVEIQNYDSNLNDLSDNYFSITEEKGECWTNKDCSSAQFCEFPEGTCQGPGTCVRKPASCVMVYEPVCGCDNETYSNDCHRQQAGVSKRYDGACTQQQSLTRIKEYLAAIVQLIPELTKKIENLLKR